MANQDDLPPSLRGGAGDDLPPSLRANATGASDDLPPSLRDQGPTPVIQSQPFNRSTDPSFSQGAMTQDSLGVQEPVEQRLLNNVNAAGAGVALPELPGQLYRAVKAAPRIIEAIKNVPEAIKASLATVFKAAEEKPAIPDLPPSLAQAPTAPSMPGQQELPLTGGAEQPRMFEPLPKPVQSGVDRISEALGQKYGGVSKHMPDMIQETAQVYAEDPAKAKAFLDDLLPRLTRVSTDPSGKGFMNALGQVGGKGSMPFPSKEIADQFGAELLAHLKNEPLLQRDIATQLGLFAPRDIPAGGPQKLLPAPQETIGNIQRTYGEVPIQGGVRGSFQDRPGFTMRNPSVQTGESGLPETFDKKILKQVRSGKIGADVPDSVPRPPVPPNYSGETIGQGTPTNPIQAPTPSAPQGQQPDTFNLERFGGKMADTPQAKLAVAIQNKDLPSPLPPGAANRLAQQAEMVKAGKLTDLPMQTPLTDRLDFNRKVEGTPTGVFYDQYKMGAQAANAVDRESSATYSQFQKQFGIAANSRESAALQVYGESQNKPAAMQALTDVFGEAKAKKIADASEWMRTQYDNQWVETNKALIASGRPAIPYRQDYFTHFKEVGLLDQMGLLTSGTPEAQAQVIARYQTADQLVQQGRFTKLKDILFPFMKRESGDFTNDAVEGFRRYVFASNRIQKLQPYVNELNESAKLLQPSLPGAAKYMQDQVNHLSGVADSWDKVVTDRLGKKALDVWVNLNRRYMSNLVEANPHVPFMHAMSESVNVAEHSLSSNLKAAVSQIMNPEARAFAIENSPTIQSRIASGDARSLDAGLVRKSITSAMTWMDQQIGIHIFNTTFKDAVAQGASVDDAVKAADYFVGKTQGMISPVNTPPIMRSRVLGNLVPFQNRALSYAKSVLSLWEDKTIPAASLSTVKFGLATAAAAFTEQEIFGHTSGVVGRMIPFGEALQRGVGGPILNTGTKVIAATDKGDFKTAATNVAKTAVMLQPWIPGAMNTVIRPGELLLKHFQENQ